MWLPRDERHLLVAYHVNIFNVNDKNVCRHIDKPKWFKIADWADILRVTQWIPILTPRLIRRVARDIEAYGEGSKTSSEDDKTMEQAKTEVRKQIRLERRLEISNAALEKRNLITMKTHNSCSDVAGISLTIEGYDLGIKYSSWWTRSGLWFAEYRHHWIWVIGSFIGGIIATLFVQLLLKVIR